VKRINNAFVNDTDARRTGREISFLRQAKAHPNIIMLHNALMGENNKDVSSHCELDLDLDSLIQEKKTLNNLPLRRHIMLQIVKTLRDLHEAGVHHRDIKPQNVLLRRNNESLVVKLADFGLVRSVNENELPEYSKAVCTPGYKAPELLRYDGVYDEKIDIWNLGLILAEMLCGTHLFNGKTP
jgi:mitogen-activated protein kinase 15